MEIEHEIRNRDGQNFLFSEYVRNDGTRDSGMYHEMLRSTDPKFVFALYDADEEGGDDYPGPWLAVCPKDCWDKKRDIPEVPSEVFGELEEDDEDCEEKEKENEAFDERVSWTITAAGFDEPCENWWVPEKELIGNPDACEKALLALGFEKSASLEEAVREDMHIIPMG